MGLARPKILFKEMKLSVYNKKCNLGTFIPLPTERIIKSASMIRQSSFSRLINTAVNKKQSNSKCLFLSCCVY